MQSVVSCKLYCTLKSKQLAIQSMLCYDNNLWFPSSSQHCLFLWHTLNNFFKKRKKKRFIFVILLFIQKHDLKSTNKMIKRTRRREKRTLLFYLKFLAKKDGRYRASNRILLDVYSTQTFINDSFQNKLDGNVKQECECYQSIFFYSTQTKQEHYHHKFKIVYHVDLLSPINPMIPASSICRLIKIKFILIELTRLCAPIVQFVLEHSRLNPPSLKNLSLQLIQ